MFIGSDKETTIKSHLRWMKDLIKEYELIKSKKHPHFRYVSDLFLKRGIKKQNFHKYYRRYQSIMDDNSLLPSKRGPKKPHQHYPALINKITSLRQQGLSRFEINSALSPILKDTCPSPSSI